MNRARRSDGELTRERILEAAGELIAEQGLAKTTNKAIASSAQVDLAAINYHFGGRDGMYLAVLSRAHRHYLDGEKLATLAASNLQAEEKLGMFLEMFISKLNEGNSWHGRVFARELLAPSVQLSDFVNNEGMGKIQSVKKIVSEAAGISENDPALLPCMISVVAPCMMLIVAGNRIPGPVREIAAMQTTVLTEHFKRFSLAGLHAVREFQKK
ncbi:TetR/AcrR family transcriptional regulator [Yersinia vastinensis]|uniref:TetR/AcrR family transcriptional regulator n=1 Tax=Yersinia vastinensis TaxID=2890318 RepID=UPI0005DA8A2D|nr:CerR family C-terminal domain-containing protein [Yersinia vastinensis]OVZ96247.1 TetR family transcriptional regulator [Yersinia frederiksenii]CNI05100.1 putative DNA-binding transcriptional regulator [Yersinia frederiksenii]CNK09391.1 putative DNA-binding transcriptional regulator [Yersinia frederiksenii]